MTTRQVKKRKKVETQPQRETGRLIRTTWWDMIMIVRYAQDAATSSQEAGEMISPAPPRAFLGVELAGVDEAYPLTIVQWRSSI